MGRSPPTRGSRDARPDLRRGRGSIPAHAGEPQANRRRIGDRRVDPRPRGGAPRPHAVTPSASGRSPPTRGSRALSDSIRDWRGSIPAHAGEPDGARPLARGVGVDPRPRGGASLHAANSAHLEGRSPPTRGSQRRACALGAVEGSIPAHAGEPTSTSAGRRRRRVDPRPRGGAHLRQWFSLADGGRSPPTRGSLNPTLAKPARRGSIPAHAGEPRARSRPRSAGWVDPRPRGGATATTDEGRRWTGRSPPTRGSPLTSLQRYGALP